MNLYDRDYSELKEDEHKYWEKMLEEEKANKKGQFFFRIPKFREHPKAIRHFQSLFPNNYLDPVDLTSRAEDFAEIVTEFENELVSEEVNERSICKFIKDKKAYFIIASLLKEFCNFGHHDTFIFPEFQLGNTWEVDYLLVGRNSDGWHFLFIELQEPTGQIVLQDGEFGKCFREGFAQLKNWESWLEAHYPTLKETFDKSRNRKRDLPDEFYTMDKTRINYCVISGRRIDFTPVTYRRARDYRKQLTIVTHYDKLVESAINIINQAVY